MDPVYLITVATMGGIIGLFIVWFIIIPMTAKVWKKHGESDRYSY